MMDFRTDLDALQKGDIVLLFFTVKGATTAVVGQLWPLEEQDGVTTLIWRETWRGERIDLTPFAYAVISEPDAALLSDGYA